MIQVKFFVIFYTIKYAMIKIYIPTTIIKFTINLWHIKELETVWYQVKNALANFPFLST